MNEWGRALEEYIKLSNLMDGVLEFIAVQTERREQYRIRGDLMLSDIHGLRGRANERHFR